MDDLFTQSARARRSDPDTSHQAANDISPMLRETQRQVLFFAAKCGRSGFIDPDMGEHFGSITSTWRTRRSELVGFGMIEDTGERATVGPRGRRFAVWRITDKGQAEAERLLDSDLPEAA